MSPVASMTLGAVRGDPRADVDDPVALDEDVGVGQLPDRGVLAEDDCVLDEDPVGHGCSSNREGCRVRCLRLRVRSRTALPCQATVARARRDRSSSATAAKSRPARPSVEAARMSSRLTAVCGSGWPSASAVRVISRRSFSVRASVNATGAVSGSTNWARL